MNDNRLKYFQDKLKTALLYHKDAKNRTIEAINNNDLIDARDNYLAHAMKFKIKSEVYNDIIMNIKENNVEPEAMFKQLFQYSNLPNCIEEREGLSEISNDITALIEAEEIESKGFFYTGYDTVAIEPLSKNKYRITDELKFRKVAVEYFLDPEDKVRTPAKKIRYRKEDTEIIEIKGDRFFRIVQVPNFIDNELLRSVWHYGQNETSPQNAPSISVSDIIHVYGEGCFRVCDMGFKRIEELEPIAAIDVIEGNVRK